MNLTSIPIIVVLCYLIGEFYKMLFQDKKEVFKYIPLISMCSGAIIGILIFYTNPETMVNVNNFWIAIGVGASSGASATGTNQIIKQLFSVEEKDE